MSDDRKGVEAGDDSSTMVKRRSSELNTRFSWRKGLSFCLGEKVRRRIGRNYSQIRAGASRGFFLAIIAALVLAGACSNPPARAPAPAAPVGQGRPTGARLSRAEVLRIAEDAAIKNGHNLTNYGVPKVVYECIVQDRTWHVFYDGKVPMPGNHFSVLVDDLTGEQRVMLGR